jgi:hypothetical protein
MWSRNCSPFQSTWVLPGFSGVCVTRSVAFWVVFCRSLIVLLSFFVWSFILSLILFTTYDNLFGIFKLFWLCNLNSGIGWLVGWWCLTLTPFTTVFHLYRGGQFYWWRKQVKISDLSQVTDKSYHIILYRVHLVMNGIRTHILSGYRHLLYM